MTLDELRDQIARDCSNPSLQDLRGIMNLPSDTPITPEKPTTGEGMEIKPAVKSVQERFMDLTLSERCRLIWKYKYIYADAALSAKRGVV